MGIWTSYVTWTGLQAIEKEVKKMYATAWLSSSFVPCTFITNIWTLKNCFVQLNLNYSLFSSQAFCSHSFLGALHLHISSKELQNSQEYWSAGRITETQLCNCLLAHIADKPSLKYLHHFCILDWLHCIYARNILDGFNCSSFDVINCTPGTYLLSSYLCSLSDMGRDEQEHCMELLRHTGKVKPLTGLSLLTLISCKL